MKIISIILFSFFSFLQIIYCQEEKLLRIDTLHYLQICDIIKGDDELIYLGTPKGIKKISDTNSKISETVQGTESYYIYSLLNSGDGNIWAATIYKRIFSSKNPAKMFNLSNTNDTGFVIKELMRVNNLIWVLTADSGIICMNTNKPGDSGREVLFNEEQKNLILHSASAMYKDYLGYIWIGASDGLYKYKDNELFCVYKRDKNERITSITSYNDSIYFIVENAKNKTPGKIYMYNRKWDKLKEITKLIYNSKTINGIQDFMADENGNLWLIGDHIYLYKYGNFIIKDEDNEKSKIRFLKILKIDEEHISILSDNNLLFYFNIPKTINKKFNSFNLTLVVDKSNSTKEPLKELKRTITNLTHVLKNTDTIRVIIVSSSKTLSHYEKILRRNKFFTTGNNYVTVSEKIETYEKKEAQRDLNANEEKRKENLEEKLGKLANKLSRVADRKDNNQENPWESIITYSQITSRLTESQFKCETDRTNTLFDLSSPRDIFDQSIKLKAAELKKKTELSYLIVTNSQKAAFIKKIKWSKSKGNDDNINIGILLGDSIFRKYYSNDEANSMIFYSNRIKKPVLQEIITSLLNKGFICLFDSTYFHFFIYNSLNNSSLIKSQSKSLNDVFKSDSSTINCIDIKLINKDDIEKELLFDINNINPKSLNNRKLEFEFGSSIYLQSCLESRYYTPESLGDSEQKSWLIKPQNNTSSGLNPRLNASFMYMLRNEKQLFRIGLGACLEWGPLAYNSSFAADSISYFYYNRDIDGQVNYRIVEAKNFKENLDFNYFELGFFVKPIYTPFAGKWRLNFAAGIKLILFSTSYSTASGSFYYSAAYHEYGGFEKPLHDLQKYNLGEYNDSPRSDRQEILNNCYFEKPFQSYYNVFVNLGCGYRLKEDSPISLNLNLLGQAGLNNLFEFNTTNITASDKGNYKSLSNLSKSSSFFQFGVQFSISYLLNQKLLNFLKKKEVAESDNVE